MTVLIGIELAGNEAVLTVVDRRGSLEAFCVEPLAAPASDWGAIHPEERVRAVVSLLERGMREGVLHGGNVAGIGLSAEPGWVFIDHELKAMPPREVGWGAVLSQHPGGTPRELLAALVAEQPTLPRKVRVVLSTLDYIRFRLTGALATHVSFAWWTGLVSPQHPDEWDAEAIAAVGFDVDQFPPILSAPERVGTVQQEISEKCGFPAGVWVHAGADPVATAGLFAADPQGDAAVYMLGDESDDDSLWRFGPAPIDTATPALPTALDDVWLHHASTAEWRDPRKHSDWRPSGAPPVVLAFREHLDLDAWPEAALTEAVAVAGDSGGPSAGVALQAGLGLGWWRDRRVLWRKYLQPLPADQWLELQAALDAAEEEVPEE